jgi:sugar phosphate isomerase/epimerase
MKLGIINSVFEQAGVETATGLEHIARLGFDCVDIHTEAIGLSKDQIQHVARTCAKLNLPIISVPHCSLGLSDFSAPVREFHIERTKRFIDVAAAWEAKNVLVVIGEYMWQREIIPPASQWAWAIESCRRIGDYAAKHRLDIALEIEPFRSSILNSIDEMVRFVDECAHERIRANIDVSHLVLGDVTADYVKKLKGKAIHVHLSDCNGMTHGDLPPGRGVVKFEPYLQAIKELEMDGVVSLELEYPPDPSRIVEWVEEGYRESARRMDLVGLRG